MIRKSKEVKLYKEFQKRRENGSLKSYVHGIRKKSYANKLKAYREFLKFDFENNETSIVRLLRFKIERNLSHLKKNHYIADPRIFDEMKEVIRLLKEVERNDFGQEKKFRAHHLKFRKLQTLDIVSSNSKERKNFLKMWRQSQSSYARIARQAQEKRRQILQRAFTIILKNIWNWNDHEYPQDRSQILRHLEIGLREKKKSRQTKKVSAL